MHLQIYLGKRSSASIHLREWAIPLHLEWYETGLGLTLKISILCLRFFWTFWERGCCDYCKTPTPVPHLIAEEGGIWSCESCWIENERIDYERSLESTMG